MPKLQTFLDIVEIFADLEGKHACDYITTPPTILVCPSNLILVYAYNVELSTTLLQELTCAFDSHADLSPPCQRKEKKLEYQQIVA